MPYYDYSCSNCNTTFEKNMKMAEMELPLSEPCPECNTTGHIEQMVTAAAFGDPIKLGIKKADAGWGEVLSKIKKAHPRGNWTNKKFTPIAGR